MGYLSNQWDQAKTRIPKMNEKLKMDGQDTFFIIIVIYFI